MRPLSKRFGLPFLSCVYLALLGCGAGDEGFADEDTTFAGDVGFDESQLPADFPTNLIPPNYDAGSYTQLGPVDGASFESRRPVQEAIAHYTGLLGEPTIDVGDADGDGETMVQWNTTPWVVSILGGDDETIVGIARPPEQ